MSSTDTSSSSNNIIDVYHLRKNSGPDPEKNTFRNRYLDYTLKYMETDQIIMKSYHVPQGKGQWSKKEHEYKDRTMLSEDLVPYVVYAKNKRKRWEIEEEIGENMLQELTDMHPNMNIVVLERILLTAYYWNTPSQYAKYGDIKKYHILKDEEEYHTKVTSGLGQKYNHFLDQNRECSRKKEKKKRMKDVEDEDVDDPIVAYNFMKAPKNYQQLLCKEYFDPNDWKYPGSAYRKRLERAKDIELGIRYTENEHESDIEWYDSGEDDQAEDTRQRREFYNLVDHIVDGFKMVKTRGKRNRHRSTNSDWSEVSTDSLQSTSS